MEKEGIGSVKTTISLYGQKFNLKNKKDLHSDSGELQIAQRRIGKLKETMIHAENEKSSLEIELYRAKSEAKELSLEIEKYNAKEFSRNTEKNDSKYYELTQELARMKQELRKLRLDVGIALESKHRAEKQVEYSNSKAKSYLTSAEKLSKEIEEANEEHVLVELARIEAEKETKEIELQRKCQAEKFSEEIDATKEKIRHLQNEINEANDLEAKLEVTNADLSVLQSEMEFVRAMEINFPKKNLLEEDVELKAAKEELKKTKEEAFQFMSSMDVIRKELMVITKEIDQLSKQEKKADITIQQLNTRLLNAKSKYEAVSIAEQRSKAIISNLQLALSQLHKEHEEAEKEKTRILEETKTMKYNINSSEKEIHEEEKMLQEAMIELHKTKAAEANAAKELRVAVERIMKSREFSFQQSTNITISKSEYEYLRNGAKQAKEVADMKVEAARAWIEALKAEEEEIVMRTELINKEVEELIEEIQDSLDVFPNSTRKATLRENRKSTASARRKVRRSSVSSSVRYNARSPSFTVKRRTTVMPTLGKLLGRKK